MLVTSYSVHIREYSCFPQAMSNYVQSSYAPPFQFVIKPNYSLYNWKFTSIPISFRVTTSDLLEHPFKFKLRKKPPLLHTQPIPSMSLSADWASFHTQQRLSCLWSLTGNIKFVTSVLFLKISCSLPSCHLNHFKRYCRGTRGKRTQKTE